MQQIMTKDCFVQALDSRGSAAVLNKEKILNVRHKIIEMSGLVIRINVLP